MILLVGNEGPDHIVRMRRLDGLGCPHIPECTFRHGAAQLINLSVKIRKTCDRVVFSDSWDSSYFFSIKTYVVSTHYALLMCFG